MSKLVWDAEGSHIYETGISNGVLYVWDEEAKAYGQGVAWNGLTSVSESPSGAESTAIYADNIKYLNLVSAETFGATIEAYTYPDAFMECDGTAEIATGAYIGQQVRKKFCFAYKTRVGNDQSGDNFGYKIHLLYNCSATPSEKQYQTVNDSPEATSFSWEISTTPATVDSTHLPTANMVIDSTKFDTSNVAKLTALEDYLFGSASAEPQIAMPSKVVELLA